MGGGGAVLGARQSGEAKPEITCGLDFLAKDDPQ